MNIDYKLIGSRIKEERKKKNISQEILAEKLGVSIGYVSQVERGITKISLDLLGAIATILDCNVALFINESAIQSNKYLTDELYESIKKLDKKQRKLALEFIELLIKYQ